MHAQLQHVINPGCDAHAVFVGPILACRQPALTATLLCSGSISHPTTALAYLRWLVRTFASDLTCTSPAALHTPFASSEGGPWPPSSSVILAFRAGGQPPCPTRGLSTYPCFRAFLVAWQAFQQTPGCRSAWGHVYLRCILVQLSGRVYNSQLEQLLSLCEHLDINHAGSAADAWCEGRRRDKQIVGLVSE